MTGRRQRILRLLWGAPDVDFDSAKKALARAEYDNAELDRRWYQVRQVRKHADQVDRRARQVEDHLSDEILNALRKAV